MAKHEMEKKEAARREEINKKHSSTGFKSKSFKANEIPPFDRL